MDDEIDTTNGAQRSTDGRFAMLPHRRFPADGREPRDPDEMYRLAEEVRKVLRFSTSETMFVMFKAISGARRRLDELEFEAVAYARSRYMSWRDIGEALGLSASTVHERYAHEAVESRRRRPRP